MEKIQSLPIKLMGQAVKETVLVNEEEFTQQFQKFSHLKEEQFSKESGLQPSEDLVSSESEKKKEKLESDDRVFTLINPFLHLQTQLIDVKSEATSEPNLALEAEGISNNSTIEKLLVTLGQSDRLNESVSYQLSHTSEAIVLSEWNPDLDAQLLKDVLLDPIEPVVIKDRASFQPFDTADVQEPTSLVNFEEEGALPLNQSVQSNKSTQSVETFNQRMHSVTFEETHRSLKSVTPEMNPEDESKTSINKVTTSDEEETLPNIFSINEVKQPSEEITKAVQLTPSKTIPVVTKEVGMDMIKEMVMETVVDESGVETVRSTIKLTPESLGEVEIELVSTDKGLTGKIVFQSEEAKQWMEKEWEQFKLPLEAKGVSFQSLELTVSQPIQTHTLQNQLGGFSFSENFSQSQQEQAANQQGNLGEGTVTNEETENRLDLVETNQLNGLNVYV